MRVPSVVRDGRSGELEPEGVMDVGSGPGPSKRGEGRGRRADLRRGEGKRMVSRRVP